MQKNRDRITAAGSLFFYVLRVHVICFLDSCLDADSFLVHPVITDLFHLAQQMFLAGENQSVICLERESNIDFSREDFLRIRQTYELKIPPFPKQILKIFKCVKRCPECAFCV